MNLYGVGVFCHLEWELLLRYGGVEEEEEEEEEKEKEEDERDFGNNPTANRTSTAR